jgi:tetrapyrrole methylase family protein / MazG family protein
MTTAAITIVGLGPGRMQDLTLDAQQVFAQAAQREQVVYFRTKIHPTTAPLQQHLPNLRIESFDRFYDESDDWQSLYQQIAEEICARAGEGPVVYAVPGHPMIGEISVQIVLRMARERKLTTQIVAGLSFIEPVCTLIGLDPFNDGMQIIDATELAALSREAVAGRIIPTIPLLVVQVYNRRLASAVKLALSDLYPDERKVQLVRAAGVSDDETIIDLPLFELDRNTFANHLSTLYVAPVDELSARRLPETLRSITTRLRREPDGCPWDRKQTHQTLTRYVIEEAYEVVEAIEENDVEHLAEELGDLLLQVYLHAEIARQADEFALGDVYEHINAKMIRRHPHIFGSTEVEDANQVVRNWEEIKRQERISAGRDVERESVLDRVQVGAPALMVTQEYQKRVAKVGFEFGSLQDVYAKLAEELTELQQAGSFEEQREEMGDLLFIVAKVARFLQIDPEEALRNANRKFRQRFQWMEQQAQAEQRELSSYTTEEWEVLWMGAKAWQKSNASGKE